MANLCLDMKLFPKIINMALLECGWAALWLSLASPALPASDLYVIIIRDEAAASPSSSSPFSGVRAGVRAGDSLPISCLLSAELQSWAGSEVWCHLCFVSGRWALLSSAQLPARVTQQIHFRPQCRLSHPVKMLLWAHPSCRDIQTV